MCEQPGRIIEQAPGIPSLTVRLIAGVASSCSPVTTSVGTRISPSRSVMSQFRSVPVTWNSLEPKLAPDDPDLVDEQLDGVHGCVVWQVRLPAAELVVEDRAPARARERLERLQVVVRAARTAVQKQDRELSLLLAVADDAVPGLEAAERQAAFLDG